MALDTPIELINSVKGRFTGKLSGNVFGTAETIKDYILKHGGELDKLSNSEHHWSLKTDPTQPSSEANGWNDWEDYINGITTFIPTASWTQDQQWGKIKGDILSVLARLIIHGVKTEQDHEADQAEKANWWNTLNTYITTYNTPIEQNTYADTSALDGANNAQIITDIRTAGTTPIPTPPLPPHGLTGFPTGHFTNVVAGGVYGRQQRTYDSMERDKKATDGDQDKYRESDSRQIK